MNRHDCRLSYHGKKQACLLESYSIITFFSRKFMSLILYISVTSDENFFPRLESRDDKSDRDLMFEWIYIIKRQNITRHWAIDYFVYTPKPCVFVQFSFIVVTVWVYCYLFLGGTGGINLKCKDKFKQHVNRTYWSWTNSDLYIGFIVNNSRDFVIFQNKT